MNKERYFAESSDRTHTLLAQIKTKNNEWVDYEKCYSKAGFSPQDYAWHWISLWGRASILGKIKNPEVRILNGMRKQVYSNASDQLPPNSSVPLAITSAPSETVLPATPATLPTIENGAPRTLDTMLGFFITSA